MRVDLMPYRAALAAAPLVRRTGRVRRVGGLTVEVQGLEAVVGELCDIEPREARGGPLAAEVVAVRSGHLVLMPYGDVQGLAAGCAVQARGRMRDIGVGDNLLGRVIDAFGDPLDGGARPVSSGRRALQAAALNPMHRPRIAQRVDTGIRVIDTLLTLGRGQRIGIFAGSGVGKSTLLGMIARHVQADVNVIALIGERGREVREFIERQLGDEGRARSVLVVAPADQPALARIRAAHAALAIAEHFRDQGRHVLLTLDSITRYAMARREVGLAAGEPPTARGYTPSVFQELPQLCERCGTAPGGGAITALMTVLVEGDDMNEPVADCMRAVLDGHIVLSRALAQQGHFPAIDVLQSTSRVMPEVVSPEHRALAARAIGVLALLEHNRQLVDIGAYEAGANPSLDAALAVRQPLTEWLRQSEGGCDAAQARQALEALLSA